MIYFSKIKHSIRSRWLILILLLCLPILSGAQDISVNVDKHANCDDVGGAISITGINPEAHSVSWTDAEGKSISTSASVSNLKSGIYFVTVMLKACDKEVYKGSAKVKKTPGFDVNISASGDIVQKCDAPSTGSVTLTAEIIGDKGGKVYKYRWSNGKTTKSITIKDPGTYSVSVSTATAKCDATDEITIKMKQVECSHDPNDIRGPEGYDEEKFVSVSSQMNYTIRFENDPVFASAPAKKVTVVLPLDENIELSSFRLSNVGFGSFNFSIPENTLAYTEVYDVVDSLGVFVRLTAGVNIVNREAFWLFESIDPETGTDPENALMGFLLVNDSLGRGEGFVNFSLKPSNDAATGDTIFAKAHIVFDENASLETNLWFNTIDAGIPVSGLKNVVPYSDDGLLSVSFDASDDATGSGVKDVTLYYSENNGAYMEIGKYHPDSTAFFSGVKGNIYNLYSVAEDNTGNREVAKPNETYEFNMIESPTGMWLSNNLFNEFSAPGTFIGKLTTRGYDFSESYIYSLADGEGDTDNALFEIDGDNLKSAVEFACMPDTTFNIRVKTTNVGGFDYQQQFTISLQDMYNEKDTIYDFIDFCEGSEVEIGEEVICEEGDYIINLVSSHGCDSVVWISAYTLPKSYIEEQTSTCDNEPYLFNDMLLDETGIYYDTLANIYGCDSVIELSLEVLPTSSSNLIATICSNETYLFNEKFLNETGIYYDTLTSDCGCDSIIELSLDVLPSNLISLSATICEGENYQFNEKLLDQTGIYYDSLTNVLGCDSIIEFSLQVVPSVQNISVNICEGETYKGWDSEGQYIEDYTSITGCDSTVITDLSFYPTYQPEITIDKNTLSTPDLYQTYEWYKNDGTLLNNASTYTILESGQYYLVVTDDNGCTNTSAIINAVYTSINSLTSEQFRYTIIPNPNNGKFTFRIDSRPESDLTLKLVNTLGQVIEIREVEPYVNHTEQFDVSHLSKGIYQLIISTDQSQKSEKIVVQ